MKLSTICAAMLITLLAAGCGKKTYDTSDLVIPSSANIPAPFFKITGVERFWHVEISGSKMRFVSINEGESFDVPYKAPAITDGGKARIYKSAAGTNELTLQVIQESCSDGNSDKKYDHLVRVTVVKKALPEPILLKGCGAFVPDQKLNAVWILRELRGQKMQLSDFGQEMPYIDLHMNDMIFSGFAGCNRIKGSLSMSEATGLKFLDVNATRMACLSGNKENVFLEALAASTQYEVAGSKLILRDNKGVQAVFVKGS